MAENLITIATFGTTVEATIVQTRLVDGDIDSFIADSNIMDMAWHLGPAIGGVKLQVLTNQVGQATQIINPYYEEQKARVKQDVIPEPSSLKESMRRCYRVGTVGLLFAPVQLYSLYLFFKLLWHQPREKYLWQRLPLVLFVNLPLLFILGWIINAIFSYALGVEYAYSPINHLTF